MEKELFFRELSLIQIFSNLVGTGLTISLAYLGYGVLSLIWGQLLRTILQASVYAFFGFKQ